MQHKQTRKHGKQRGAAETTRAEAVRRESLYILQRSYPHTDTWIINAWRLETAADEPLPPRLAKAAETMRINLYSYISGLGAEWSPEDDNTIILKGSPIEAAKVLKALWLSLHLAYVTPADTETQPETGIEEIYKTLEHYNTVYTRITRRYKPVPYVAADKLLEAAAALALAGGAALPEDFEAFGAIVLVTDMLYAVSLTIK